MGNICSSSNGAEADDGGSNSERYVGRLQWTKSWSINTGQMCVSCLVLSCLLLKKEYGQHQPKQTTNKQELVLNSCCNSFLTLFRNVGPIVLYSSAKPSSKRTHSPMFIGIQMSNNKLHVTAAAADFFLLFLLFLFLKI